MNETHDLTTYSNWQDRPCIEYLGEGEGARRWQFKVCLLTMDLMVMEASVLARTPKHLRARSPTCHPIDISGQLYVSEYEALMRIFMTCQTQDMEDLRRDILQARVQAMVALFHEMAPVLAETNALEERAMELCAKVYQATKRPGQAPN